MNTSQYNVHGAGLGLRRSIMAPLADQPPTEVDFMEVAPENWIGVGGKSLFLTTTFAFTAFTFFFGLLAAAIAFHVLFHFFSAAALAFATFTFL